MHCRVRNVVNLLIATASVAAVIAQPGSIGRAAGSPLQGLPASPRTNVRSLSDSPGVGLPWRQPTSLPEAVTRPAVAVGRDGTVYVFGGGAASSVSNATFIYHPTNNTWTEGADLPTAREGAQAVTLPDGRIAVLGGGRSATGPMAVKKG